MTGSHEVKSSILSVSTNKIPHLSIKTNVEFLHYFMQNQKSSKVRENQGLYDKKRKNRIVRRPTNPHRMERNRRMTLSIVDVVGVLPDQPDARHASTYWAVLKNRMSAEGADQLLTNCKQLKLKASDGKSHKGNQDTLSFA